MDTFHRVATGTAFISGLRYDYLFSFLTVIDVSSELGMQKKYSFLNALKAYLRSVKFTANQIILISIILLAIGLLGAIKLSIWALLS